MTDTTDTYEQEGCMCAHLYLTARREHRRTIIQECADSAAKTAWTLYYLMHDADGAARLETFINDLEQEQERRRAYDHSAKVANFNAARFAITARAWRQ